MIIAGVEIHRFGLQDELLALAEQAGIPIAATMLGKSVVSETHPLFVGLYEGAMGHDEVTQFVEESDCVILLGAFMTDINLGIFTANLDPGNCIYATSEQLRIRHHHYHECCWAIFIQQLIRRQPRPPERPIPAELRPQARATFGSSPTHRSRSRGLMRRLNQQLDE